MQHVRATMIALLTLLIFAGCGDEASTPTGASGPEKAAQSTGKAAAQDVAARLRRAQAARVWLLMSELGKAVEMYQLDNRGRVPNSLGELTQTDKDMGEPYIDRIPEDAWGNDFDYRPDVRRFTIVSAGADERLGTADDLVFPKPEK